MIARSSCRDRVAGTFAHVRPFGLARLDPHALLNPRRAYVAQLWARSRALQARMISDNAPTLILHGEIGPDRSSSASTVRKFLHRIGPIADVKVAVDSDGGSVVEAQEIAAALLEHRGAKLCRVRRAAHSAAVVVVAACEWREARLEATFLLHRCQLEHPKAMTAAEFRFMARLIDGADREYAAAVAARSKLSERAVAEFMRRGMRLSACQALHLGIVDAVIGHG